MIKRWLYYLSPLVLVAIASLVLMAIHWLLFIPALLLLGVDYFLKNITDGNILSLWIKEIILIAILLLLYGGFIGAMRCGF